MITLNTVNGKVILEKPFMIIDDLLENKRPKFSLAQTDNNITCPCVVNIYSL